MPAALVPIITAIGTGVGGLAGATLIMYSGAIATGLFMAGALAYGSYQSSQARRKARDSYNASLQDRTVMTATTDKARSRVYGRVRNTDGVLFKATHGDKKQFYTFVVALAGHEIDGIETVYFGDQQVELDGSGYVTTEPYGKTKAESRNASGTITGGSGSVTLPVTPLAGSVHAVQSVGVGMDAYDLQLSVSVLGNVVSYSGGSGSGSVSVWYQVNTTTSKARVRKYLGSPSQDLSADLMALDIRDDNGAPMLTAAHKFRGIACVLVTFEYDQDAFPSGVPSISAVIRGAKAFDPRLGAVNWTQNPAVIARDWALYQYGGACTSADLDEPWFVAAANACDVLHSFTLRSPDGLLPPITRSYVLYASGIVCPLDLDPYQAFGKIAESMAGKFGWNAGKLRVRAGSYIAPAITITDDWLSGAEAIEITPENATADAVNTYHATIADSQQDYAAVKAPELRAAAYVTLDGTVLARDIQLDGVTNNTQAQNVCGVLLRDERSALTVKLPCNLRALQVGLFETVYVTLSRFGWVAKEFECIDRGFTMTGGVILTLKETAASIFDPDAEFTLADATPNTALPKPWEIQAITGLTAASGTAQLLRQSDGTIVSRIKVTWDALTDEAVLNSGGVEILYGRPSESDELWQSVTAEGGQASAYLTGLQDGAIYIIKARAYNALVRGAWCPPIVNQVVGKTDLPGNVAGLAASVVAAGVRIDWAPNAESDYAATELRLGGSWAAGSRLFRGAASGYTWLSPGAASYTVWAKHEDTTGNQSAAAQGIALTVTASGAIEWSSIAGRPKSYRVASVGLGAVGNPAGAGLYDAESGAVVTGAGSGYNIVKINRSTGVVTHVMSEQPLNSGTGANIAAALNAIGSDHIVIVYTYDEPQTNRLTGGLPDALYRCGGSGGIFAGDRFNFRGAYMLIGIPGCGEGNGFEVYAGDGYSAANAWIDTSFQVVNGNPLTSSGSSLININDGNVSTYIADEALKTAQLKQNAATDPVSTKVPAGSVCNLPAGGGSATQAICAVSYTNPLPYSVFVELSANIAYARIERTVTSQNPSGYVWYEYSTAASGSGNAVFIPSFSNNTYIVPFDGGFRLGFEATSATGTTQVLLAGGDTLTLTMKGFAVHNNAARIEYESALVRIVGIKR